MVEKSKGLDLRLALVLTAAALLATPAATEYVPYGAPADVPPLSQVIQEGNSSSAPINMSFNRIRSVAAPVADKDAANKGYVDNQIITQTSDDQNLSEVLQSGNSADTSDIDLSGNSLKSSDGEICIGDQCS